MDYKVPRKLVGPPDPKVVISSTKFSWGSQGSILGPKLLIVACSQMTQAQREWLNQWKVRPAHRRILSWRNGQ